MPTVEISLPRMARGPAAGWQMGSVPPGDFLGCRARAFNRKCSGVSRRLARELSLRCTAWRLGEKRAPSRLFAWF